jgi:hypothetical protein
MTLNQHNRKNKVYIYYKEFHQIHTVEVQVIIKTEALS